MIDKNEYSQLRKSFYVKLLNFQVDGLRANGYKENGGSDVFRLLTAPDGTEIKMFLNNYDCPTRIVTRISVEGKNFE